MEIGTEKKNFVIKKTNKTPLLHFPSLLRIISMYVEVAKGCEMFHRFSEH